MKLFEKQTFVMGSERLYYALKYSLLAPIFISFIWLISLVLVDLPDFNNLIFVLLIGVPIISMFISLVCTIIFLIPSVLLLKKVNLDKKIPVIIIGAIVGVLLWYLSTVELKSLFIFILYAAVCSYAFMVGYEKYQKNN